MNKKKWKPEKIISKFQAPGSQSQFTSQLESNTSKAGQSEKRSYMQNSEFKGPPLNTNIYAEMFEYDPRNGK